MNRPDRIVLRLASPALFVGASADGTGADTDVVTDGHGLPYLPRHRLAARLRTAALDAATVAPDLAEAVERLFGSEGSHGADRALRVGHALPSDPVRAAVAHALAGRAGPARTTLRRAVTEAHTTLETGVEIGPDGAAEPGRLRTHRALLPGLLLTASLTWALAPSGEDWRCLARACLATDRIGLRSTRGRGRVDVYLARPEDPDPRATTLALARPPVRPGPADPPAETPTGPPPGPLPDPARRTPTGRAPDPGPGKPPDPRQWPGSPGGGSDASVSGREGRRP